MANVLKREKQIAGLAAFVRRQLDSLDHAADGRRPEYDHAADPPLWNDCRDSSTKRWRTSVCGTSSATRFGRSVRIKEGHLRGNGNRRSRRSATIYLLHGPGHGHQVAGHVRRWQAHAGSDAGFIADLEKRPVRRRSATATTAPDQHRWFESVRARDPRSFGGSVRHGVLMKNYVNPEVGRYAPPDLVKPNG